MQKYYKGTPLLYAKNRKAWRTWLEKNHAKEKAVWVVRYKKASGKPSVNYDEIVEEALCFGWIDSTANPLDEESSLIYVAQRKEKGVWSKRNKERIEKLMQQKLITTAGLEKIEIAKKTGSWDTLNASENYEMPPELKKALTKNKTAHKYFEAFPPSTKKVIYKWIYSAKQDATKQKRITETVSLASKNIRAHQ